MLIEEGDAIIVTVAGQQEFERLRGLEPAGLVGRVLDLRGKGLEFVHFLGEITESLGNLIDRGDLVAARAFCNVRDIPAGSSSVTFNMPTAAVSSQTGVRAYTLLSFVTPSGFSREVVSRPAIVTLNPGGTTPPPPPLASFTMSPSTIGPGGQSLIDVVLTHMAPAEALPGQQGTTVQVTSSNPSVVSVSTNALPVVQPGCATGGGAFTLHAANQVPQQTVVDITANSGTGASVTNPITVTAGCVPKSCLDIPANDIDPSQPGMHCIFRLILIGHRIPEIGENAIPHVLGDVTFKTGHYASDRVLITGYHRSHIFRIEPSRQRGRSDQIDEHHRQMAPLGVMEAMCRLI